MKKSTARWFLIALLFFNAIGAYYGSFMLISDPTGAKLKAPLEALNGTMFHDFLMPGIILFIVNGLLPTIAALGMLTNKLAKPLPIFSLLSKYHWAWSMALIAGIGLFTWIVAQILIIGYWKEPPFQIIYGSLGLVIICTTLMPSVRQFYLLKR